MKAGIPSAIVTATFLTLLIDAQAGAQPCSQACLAQVMADFKASVLARKTVELAKDAEVRENMEITTVDKAAWKDVKSVKSSVSFADAVTGNVVSRDGVEMSDGKAPTSPPA
jgi:hypothetical protein